MLSCCDEGDIFDEYQTCHGRSAGHIDSSCLPIRLKRFRGRVIRGRGRYVRLCDESGRFGPDRGPALGAGHRLPVLRHENRSAVAEDKRRAGSGGRSQRGTGGGPDGRRPHAPGVGVQAGDR